METVFSSIKPRNFLSQYKINVPIGFEFPEIDLVDSSHFCRSVYRRKTDLMPTIPSPRDHSHYFGSKSSICNTPRTPGKFIIQKQNRTVCYANGFYYFPP